MSTPVHQNIPLERFETDEKSAVAIPRVEESVPQTVDDVGFELARLHQDISSLASLVASVTSLSTSVHCLPVANTS
ncbi:hypothetical protein JCM8547_000776 [Rhodosporidiobolus lusitaniae]